MATRSAAECAFANNGQYLAHISHDGRLKVWDCDSGLAKQEFIPSSHLSAACTCLVWAPLRQNEQGPGRKKKKRKSNGVEEGTGSDVIALGTASGSILLYSVNRAELQSQLTGGHRDKIYSLCWNHTGTSLFSSSADRKIIEWDVVKGVVTSQWKVDKSSVFKLALLQDNQTLVTAGHSIQCWNLSSKTVVTTFTGHANNVTHLLPIHLAGDKSGYFLSSAEGDRSVSAWRYTGTSKTSQAVATFSLQDDPVSLNVSRPSSEEEPIVLAAVTFTGLLQIFEHHLNGRLKKPLEPKVTVHIASDTPGLARPLPVLAAYPCGDAGGHCMMVYGSLIRPGFEKLSFRTQDAISYLIRRDPLVLEQARSSDQPAMKTRTPVVPSDVKTLAPEHMVPHAAASGEAQNRKRRPNSISEPGGSYSTKDSLPMEQRLSALNLDKTVDAVAPPQADNLAQLLLQGLHSRDNQIIQSVLDRGDPQIIANTIRRIPVQAVLPLLFELTRVMQYKGQPSHSYAKWLRALLEQHAGFLTSCPDLATVLTPLLALMTARTSLLPKVSQLRGRLDLMLGELRQRNEQKDGSATDLPAEALLVYQEESSDEASEEGDWPLQSGSESEDQWDELSDMDNGEVMDVNDTKEDDDEEDDDDDLDIEEDDDDDVVENGVSD